MHHIVCTKMADHHRALFPLWYAWYTQIYKADTIILIGVQTPRSSTAATIRWWQERLPTPERPRPFLCIDPKTRQFFDDEEIHRDFVGWLRAWVKSNPDTPYSVIFADADEFYEPLVPAAAHDSRLAYCWTEMATDMLGGAGRPCDQHYVAMWHTGWKGAMLNCFEHPDVSPCGHVYLDKDKIRQDYTPQCFHLCYSGYPDFANKVRTVCLPPTAPEFHWSFYRRLWDDHHENRDEHMRLWYERVLLRDPRTKPCPWAEVPDQYYADKFKDWLKQVKL